jgi:protein TonB
MMRTILWCSNTFSSRGGLLLLSLSLFATAQSPPPLTTQGPTESHSQPQRLQVSERTTSELRIEKAPPKYPEESLRAGVEGTVVLQVDIDISGAVQNVAVVSGDPNLAKAGVDAVRQWKYKPYLVNDSPIEITTQVTLNFRLTSRKQPQPPPPGTFRENSYLNEYFGLLYPLSRDWVRATQLIRKKYAESNVANTYVLLSEIHIPQDNTELRADSSFTLFAVDRSAINETEDCKQFLESWAKGTAVNKTGKQKGEIRQFAISGFDFYSADFEYYSGPTDRSIVCTLQKDYFLLWNIQAWAKSAVRQAVSTLDSIVPVSAEPTPVQDPPSASKQTPAAASGLAKIRVAPGVTIGLVLKKVQPVYPTEARKANIHGTVLLSAVINKFGDVVDLEVLDGPIELAVSAVNAVRLWKYRPYMLNGEPVSVLTQILVNYQLN